MRGETLLGNGRNTVSRVLFRRRELTEPHWVLGQTRWVLRKTHWVRVCTQIIDWEELTEFAPRNSVRAKKLTEFGVWNRALRNRIWPVSDLLPLPPPPHPWKYPSRGGGFIKGGGRGGIKFLPRGGSKYPYGSDNGPHLWPKLDQLWWPLPGKGCRRPHKEDRHETPIFKAFFGGSVLAGWRFVCHTGHPKLDQITAPFGTFCFSAKGAVIWSNFGGWQLMSTRGSRRKRMMKKRKKDEEEGEEEAEEDEEEEKEEE